MDELPVQAEMPAVPEESEGAAGVRGGGVEDVPADPVLVGDVQDGAAVLADDVPVAGEPLLL